MSNVLVTGAGGYIGCILVPMLLEKGHDVTVVDRYFFGRDLLPESDRLTALTADVRRLDPSVFDGMDAVIDLAAISNDPSGELYQAATWQINHEARVRTARLAKERGVSRYVLPSSCSVYGFQDAGLIADETSETNPLTTYARANLAAEEGALLLADDSYVVIVLRQATVYGLSPRMRFDLAINGMAYGAWKTGRLPLMRDGSQWRPMVHVQDTAAAMCFMLEASASRVNGERFNIGSEENNYQIGPLAKQVAAAVPRDVCIEWYGDPDHRSYRVNFDKVESLGWRATRVATDGVAEICQALETGRLEKTPKTITLDWYQELVRWHKIIKEVELHGGIIDL